VPFLGFFAGTHDSTDRVKGTRDVIATCRRYGHGRRRVIQMIVRRA
jgi:hypothetical protein